jgi:hypothetical protein
MKATPTDLSITLSTALNPIFVTELLSTFTDLLYASQEQNYPPGGRLVASRCDGDCPVRKYHRLTWPGRAGPQESG